MGRKSYKALIVVCVCWLAACVKDKPNPTNTSLPGATGNIYVVCEGSYQNDNGALYAWQPLLDTVFGDLYSTANSQPLGDVFQSMQHIGSNLFLCVNNSGKVVILNATNWKLAGTISIPFPRYILPISATKAYVSSEYGNKVYIINPEAKQLTDSISLPNLNTEGMCLYNNTAIICTWDTAGKNVYQVDVTSDKVVRTITTAGYAPQEALLDKEQMLWVLGGDQYDGKTATLTRIDPSTGDVLMAYVFPADANTVRPVFNNTKDTLYFIEANQYGGTADNGIYRMSIHSAALPSQPFVAAKQFQYFWALGIEPQSGNLYIGDPKSFSQKGSVYIYQPDGTQVGTFNVGVGPGHFYFDE